MRRLLPGAMVALVTLIFAEGQRAYFGSLFGLGYQALFPTFRPGATALASVPLLVILAPLIPLPRWTGRRTAVALAATAAALARLAMIPSGHAARLVGGALVVAASAAFLVWAIGRLDRRAAAAGLVLGLVIDPLLRVAGASYDLTLQPGWWPVPVGLALALVGAAWSWHGTPGSGESKDGLERRAGGLRLRGGLALGALLFIDLHVLSPAVVGRWTEAGYGAAALWLSVTGAIALWVAVVRARPTGRRGLALGLVGVVTAGVLLGYHVAGPAMAGVMALAHGASLLLVTRAVDPASGRRGGAPAVAALAVLVLAVAIYGLSFYAAFTLPQLAGAAPWVMGAAGLLVAGCFVLMPRPQELEPGAPGLAGAGIAVLVVATTLLVRPGGDGLRPAPDSGTFRVVTWNVHFGFDEQWRFSPERMARALSRERPDVVALQETIVGGPTAYGIDLPFWLGRRLGLVDRFSATVNGLQGEAFLTPDGWGDVVATSLPPGRGAPKQLLQLRVPGPAPVTINALHLSIHADARAGQIRTVLERVPAGPAVVLGDLNAEPGSPVTEALRTAGFADAFDGPAPATFPAGEPTVRIDWVWTRGVEYTEPAVLPDPPSDHRAVAATLHIRRGGVRSSNTHDLQAP